MIVLDTNVLSELVRSAPDAAVLAWVGAQRRSELCTTAVTEAELAYGLAAMPKGRRREALDQALSRLLGEGLGGRVLPFDRAAARAYADFATKRRAAGRPVAMADAQIAAISRSRGAEVGARDAQHARLRELWGEPPGSLERRIDGVTLGRSRVRVAFTERQDGTTPS